MHGKSWRRAGAIGSVGVAVVFLVSGCGGGSASASPSTVPPASATATAIATATPAATATSAATSTAAPTATPAATAGASASPTPAPGGAATLDAPATVGAATEFAVSWTGPNAQGDYVALMASGALKWTKEPYFYTTVGSPGKLVAPTTAGAYELWYVAADETILARRPFTVAPFQGSLEAAATVAAGTSFNVTWTGPDGPRDYVTIVAAGVAKWTTEPYFYTSVGSSGALIAPMTAGDFELLYVTGASDSTMVRRPITVTPLQITLQAPATVTKGSTFTVTWTGPDGPRDYVTIVPAGSPVGTYLSYAYTADGSPATLTAPGAAGKYEIWYASDRVTGIFKSIPIVVK